MSYSQRKVLKALRGHGFEVTRQGARHIIVQNDEGVRIAVPRHRQLQRGTVRGIAEDAGADWDSFQREVT